jgi:hypothetical protein
MGMYAEIVAIGSFRRDLVPFYEYPEDFYAKTLPDAFIVTHLFGIGEGSSTSRQFARFLGIDDAWDFNQHKIDPARIDMAGLSAFLGSEYSKDCEALRAFANAGYDLYFLPNG